MICLRILLAMSLLFSVVQCKKTTAKKKGVSNATALETGANPDDASCVSLNLFTGLSSLTDVKDLSIETVELSCVTTGGEKGKVCRPSVSVELESESSLPDAYLVKLCAKNSSNCQTKVVGSSAHVNFLPVASMLSAQAKACVTKERAPAGAKATDNFKGTDLYCGAMKESASLTVPSFAQDPVSNKVATLLKELESIEDNIGTQSVTLYKQLKSQTQSCTDKPEQASCKDLKTIALASSINLGQFAFTDLMISGNALRSLESREQSEEEGLQLAETQSTPICNVQGSTNLQLAADGSSTQTGSGTSNSTEQATSSSGASRGILSFSSDTSIIGFSLLMGGAVLALGGIGVGTLFEKNLKSIKRDMKNLSAEHKKSVEAGNTKLIKYQEKLIAEQTNFEARVRKMVDVEITEKLINKYNAEIHAFGDGDLSHEDAIKKTTRMDLITRLQAFDPNVPVNEVLDEKRAKAVEALEKAQEVSERNKGRIQEIDTKISELDEANKGKKFKIQDLEAKQNLIAERQKLRNQIDVHVDKAMQINETLNKPYKIEATNNMLKADGTMNVSTELQKDLQKTPEAIHNEQRQLLLDQNKKNTKFMQDKGINVSQIEAEKRVELKKVQDKIIASREDLTKRMATEQADYKKSKASLKTKAGFSKAGIAGAAVGILGGLGAMVAGLVVGNLNLASSEDLESNPTMQEITYLLARKAIKEEQIVAVGMGDL